MTTTPTFSPHWESMWSHGLGKGDAFDVGGVSASLYAELSSSRMLKPAPGKSALVPGCGRAYDAVALAQYGFDSVTAVDVSESACKAAKLQLDTERVVSLAKKVEIVNADFFALDEGKQYDFVWDCTFLCALEPALREGWAKKYQALLAPGGTLLTCVFPIAPGKVGGPPFALSVELVTSLLEPLGFSAVSTHECADGEKHNPGGVSGLGSPGTTLVQWKRG